MEWLTSISAIVFLDAPLEAIRAHIESQAPRGIIGMPQGGLEELCRERVPRYRSYAGIIVRFTDQTPEEVATMVLSQLRIGR
jgi:shikimate kinase